MGGGDGDAVFVEDEAGEGRRVGGAGAGWQARKDGEAD